jgi:hypothetical protein
LALPVKQCTGATGHEIAEKIGALLLAIETGAVER